MLSQRAALNHSQPLTLLHVVTPPENIITVLALEGDTYTEHGIFQRGDRAVSKLLDGFSVSVAEVLDAE
jgi:hypothetical protein